MLSGHSVGVKMLLGHYSSDVFVKAPLGAGLCMTP